MVRRVRAAGGRVRAVLFWQGEADARDRMSSSAYAARLRTLARDVRRDVGAPLVVAQIGDFGPLYPAAGVDNVRLAQSASWGRARIIAGPVLYDIDLGGLVHFDAADDVEAAAHRWAAAIIRGVLHGAADGSPRLLRAVRTAAERSS